MIVKYNVYHQQSESQRVRVRDTLFFSLSMIVNIIISPTIRISESQSVRHTFLFIINDSEYNVCHKLMSVKN